MQFVLSLMQWMAVRSESSLHEGGLRKGRSLQEDSCLGSEWAVVQNSCANGDLPERQDSYTSSEQSMLHGASLADTFSAIDPKEASSVNVVPMADLDILKGGIDKMQSYISNSAVRKSLECLARLRTRLEAYQHEGKAPNWFASDVFASYALICEMMQLGTQMALECVAKWADVGSLTAPLTANSSGILELVRASESHLGAAISLLEDWTSKHYCMDADEGKLLTLGTRWPGCGSAMPLLKTRWMHCSSAFLYAYYAFENIERITKRTASDAELNKLRVQTDSYIDMFNIQLEKLQQSCEQ
ncbi:hypothetical protein PAPHI01_1840 [Pancytospora philotis]|nr:hypothetical protein PAPHI01_1840 [Pancytospora philotis]